MAQVNFYALSSEGEESRLQFACRLAEKALALGHKVFIRVDSVAQQKRIDDLLWEFRASSFVPHGIATESGESESVLIGEDYSAATNDVLINLSTKTCEQHENFSRINEILSSEPDSLAAGRNNYRYYQSQGLSPQTHKL